jgi:hypothetical protein
MLVLVIEIVKGSRQNECLANFAQRDAFRRIAERGLKAFDGFPQWLETELERLMVTVTFSTSPDPAHGGRSVVSAHLRQQSTENWPMSAEGRLIVVAISVEVIGKLPAFPTTTSHNSEEPESQIPKKAGRQSALSLRWNSSLWAIHIPCRYSGRCLP